MPILSLQCINTRSAFSLANFSTSLAALPAIRCHSGTLFRFNWSCGKQIWNNDYRGQILSYWAFCWLRKRCTDVMRSSRYRGDFQVVTNMHSVHIFLRDWVRTVQVSQQACWLRAHKTKWNDLNSVPQLPEKSIGLHPGVLCLYHHLYTNSFFHEYWTGIKYLFKSLNGANVWPYQYPLQEVHGNRVLCRPQAHKVTTQLPDKEKSDISSWAILLFITKC